MALTVTAIGSCRVWDPLACLAVQGRVKLDQTGVYGRTHTTREILQVMASMAGELSVPEELRPYVMSGTDVGEPDDCRNDLAETDILVVEIASPKLFAFRDLFLQLTVLNQSMGKSPAVRKWWRNLFSDRSGLYARRDVIAAAGFSGLQAEIVAELEARMQTPQDIRDDMELIAARFTGPVLFVPHFNVPTPEKGELLPERVLIASAVTNAGMELGHRVYDPSNDILEYVREQGGSLESAVPDMQHYTRQFVDERLSERLYDEVLAAADSVGAVPAAN